ncbi:hypothetical protein JTB14_019492 [Gonioctena quinquepunctata]|nr:hypothetical protein JTB14_019492 [Gonioctena quinquepunctata]
MSLPKIIYLLWITYFSSAFNCVSSVEPDFYSTESFYSILVPNGSQFSSPGSKVKRIGKYSRCGSILNLLECDSLETRSFLRKDINIIGSKYEPGNECDIKKVSFDWTLSFGNGTMCNHFYYNDSDTFVMKPLSLEMGKYRMVLNVVEYYNNGMRNMLSDECAFTIITEQPVIAGDEKIPRDGDLFSMDGRGIINPNVPCNGNESFTNVWHWDETEKNHNDFHKRSLANDTILVKPKKSFSDGSRSFRKPKVHLDDLIMKCENCDPEVDVTKQVTVTVECSEYCGEMKPRNYSWSIDIPGFNYEKNTVSGRYHEEFLIKPRVLQAGKSYEVKVTVYIGGFLTPTITLRTSQKTGPYSCEINPKIGLSLKTKFRVNCTFQEQLPFLFELRDEWEFLVASGPNVEELPFLLNGNKVVTVNFFDEDHVCYGSDDLDVTVTSVFDRITTNEDLKKEVEDLFFDENSNKSLRNLMNSKEYDEFVQYYKILTQGFGTLDKKDEFKDIIEDYDKKLLKMLEEIPPQNEKKQGNLPI